jgi:ankyrin repeat protein
MSAAREGHLSMVDLLIGIGADPNIQDDVRFT